MKQQPDLISETDSRPRTAVHITYSGIGDLVWHLSYFRAVAASSFNGQVIVIAAPSTHARKLLADTPWVERVVEIDHRPRAKEARRGRHQGIRGLWRFAGELRTLELDRMVLFSGRASRAFIAFLAGIPRRSGYGFSALERLWLNEGSTIVRYKGSAVALYEHASAFALAQGFCENRLVPRLDLGDARKAAMRERLADLPRPLLALGIGTSEPSKQWGKDNFATVARAYLQAGGGVLLLGGPAEMSLAKEIATAVGEPHAHNLRILCEEHILDTAAALTECVCALSNDTGVAQLAAACCLPSYVLLGSRPSLTHDPLIHTLHGVNLASIRPDYVLTQILPS